MLSGGCFDSSGYWWIPHRWDAVFMLHYLTLFVIFMIHIHAVIIWFTIFENQIRRLFYSVAWSWKCKRPSCNLLTCWQVGLILIPHTFISFKHIWIIFYNLCFHQIIAYFWLIISRYRRWIEVFIRAWFIPYLLFTWQSCKKRWIDVWLIK